MKNIDDLIEGCEKVFEELYDTGYDFGLSDSELEPLGEQQRKMLCRGEFYERIFKKSGIESAKSLWDYKRSIGREWFDHRLHILHPEKWFADHWTMSANNVLPYIKHGATVLNLCSGDGFYDYHFYSKRAGKIVCVEFDQNAVIHAKRNHQTDNIEYIHGDVLKYDTGEDVYDVVIIRGAIEHFHREEQEKIFALAQKALKSGGWFVGDTPQKLEHLGKQHPDHHCEWGSEEEMVEMLSGFFTNIKSSSFVSNNKGQVGAERITLFWACQKN